MIRRHAVVFRLSLMAADATLAVLVVLGAAVLRFGDTRGLATLNDSVANPGVALAVFVTVWIGTLWFRGLYRVRARWTMTALGRDVLAAWLLFSMVLLSLLYLFKLPDVSRLLVISILPGLAMAAFSIRLAVRMLLRVLREHGRNNSHMLVIGANARAKAFADLVEAHPELGLVVIGHLKADATDNGVWLKRPLLGPIEDLETILHTQIVDEVAICLPFAKEELIEQAALLCEQEGKTVRIPVAPMERVVSNSRLENVAGIGVYSLANAPDRTLALLGKRILDFAGSVFLISVLSPVFLALAILIRLDSKGGVFFRQERVGLHGRTFRVVKFRSMCIDAEKKLEALREQNEIQGHAFKMENDPRITRMGRFLRRTSLDELPQLLNVFRGEMSLVGPRPPLPCEVAEYDVWHRRRLSMKPGMTGLWQVAARGEPVFDRWVEKDLQYIDEWSLWLDLKIIARTVPAMLNGR